MYQLGQYNGGHYYQAYQQRGLGALGITQTVKNRRAHGACRERNALAYDWTAAKIGLTPGAQGIYGKYVGHYARPPTSEQHTKMLYECANGYPMYMQFQFQEAARKLIPTAEETAEAFVEEIKTIAPPLVTPPVVVTPYDEMKRHQGPGTGLAPPPPATMPPVTPVDSVTQAPPPAAVAAAFPLMEQFRREQIEIRAQPAANATAPKQIEAAQKKGAGIGTILALGIPAALMLMG